MNVNLAVKIASRSLLLIGDKPLSNFNEESDKANIVNLLYETTLLSLISSYPWNFCTSKRELNKETATPIIDWQYQYKLPTDFVILKSCTAGLNYEIISDDLLLCDHPSLYITYIRRPDESYFQPWFTECFEYLLASKISVLVTEKAQVGELMFGIYQKLYSQAISTDGKQVPNPSMAHRPLVNCVG